MSQSSDKSFRRQVKKILAPEWDKFFKEIESMGFRAKFSIAWAILIARKTREERKEQRRMDRAVRKDARAKRRKHLKKLRKTNS